MKRFFLSIAVFVALSQPALAALSWSHGANPVGFSDANENGNSGTNPTGGYAPQAYHGANHAKGNSNDVFGNWYQFDNYYLETSLQSNGELRVKINTEFAGQQAYFKGAYYYGDLFFDTSYDLYGTASQNARGDNASRGEKFNYVVHIDNIDDGNVDGSFSGKSATVYQVSDAQYAGSVQVSDVRGGRHNHEVRVDPTGLTGLATATWGIDLNGSNGDANDDTWIVFDFNLQEIGILNDIIPPGEPTSRETKGFSLAYHWTMSCGNDVIQGVLDYQVENTDQPPGNSVPEPAGMALFGVGMVGMVAARRRRRRLG